MRLTSPLTVLTAGYDTPEGPAFDQAGDLLFVSSDTGSILRVTPEGLTSLFVNTGGIPAGLAFHPDGTLFIADSGPSVHGILTVTPDGAMTTVVDAYDGTPFNGANDLVFAANGMLYFSDPYGSTMANPVGAFYRLHPDRRLEQIDRGLAFPNGVALAADGSAVFLAETWPNRIHRYPIAADGTIGPRAVFAELSGEPGPDGMAFDENGDLYVAHYDGERVDVIDPSGAVVDAIPVPGAKPTNAAFGGPGRTTLVVTEHATRSVYRATVAVPGQRLYGDTPD